MAPEKDITDVREVVSKLEQLWRPLAEGKGVTFTCYVEDSLSAPLKLDRSDFQDCANSLLSNAVQHTSNGRIHVHVTASPVDNSEDIEVTFIAADTGEGIATDKQSRLFETHKTLFMTQNTARNMGGDLAYISKEGRGSEFIMTVRAPLAKEKPSEFNTLDIGYETTTGPEDQPKQGFDPDNLRGLKVLIVEDVPSNQEVVKLFLTPEGCNCVCANNGEEALALIQAQDFDFILMDIRMPGMDGIETTRAIRNSEPAYRDTPIIALTADTSAQTNAECMAAGADIFLSKPIMGRDLTEAMKFLRRFQEMEDETEDENGTAALSLTG